MSLYDFVRSLILPLDLIDQTFPLKGTIVDLGCGQGMIAQHLSQKRERRIIGVDKNNKRLPKSKQANLKFVAADITSYKLENPHGVIISDVLHHLSLKDQKKLLIKISKYLKEGGVLIIKEIDKSEFVRSNLSRVWDFIFYPKDKIHYWGSSDLKTYLRSLKFNVKIIRASRFFPGSTTLYFCKK